MSAEHIIEELDNGVSLEKLFTERTRPAHIFYVIDGVESEKEYGYDLEVQQIDKTKYEIAFGWADGTIGDGGTWLVEFDKDDNVVRCEGVGCWVA